MRWDRMAAEESFTQRYAAAQAAAVVERLATLTAAEAVLHTQACGPHHQTTPTPCNTERADR